MSVKKPRKSPSTKRKTRIRLFWRYTTRSRVCAEDDCNQFSDFLAKTAKTFRRELLFIGCSIPVWLPRPPQA
ncbi:hypothetical protein YC2023_002360 [Brassica napus]